MPKCNCDMKAVPVGGRVQFVGTLTCIECGKADDFSDNPLSAINAGWSTKGEHELVSNTDWVCACGARNSSFYLPCGGYTMPIFEKAEIETKA